MWKRDDSPSIVDSFTPFKRYSKCWSSSDIKPSSFYRLSAWPIAAMRWMLLLLPGLWILGRKTRSITFFAWMAQVLLSSIHAFSLTINRLMKSVSCLAAIVRAAKYSFILPAETPSNTASTHWRNRKDHNLNDPPRKWGMPANETLFGSWVQTSRFYLTSYSLLRGRLSSMQSPASTDFFSYKILHREGHNKVLITQIQVTGSKYTLWKRSISHRGKWTTS